VAYTTAEIRAATGDLRRRHHDAEAAWLATMWSTAARPSDVDRLRAEHVAPTPGHRDDGGSTLRPVSVTFVEGKGVHARQAPYTVHALLPPPDAEWMSARVAELRQGLLFAGTVDRRTARAALRRAAPNKRLDLRGARRGALQTLAAGCHDDAILRSFSGHRRPETLERYLGWGLFADAKRCEQHAAARNTLW
jgi:hypothetical protein